MIPEYNRKSLGLGVSGIVLQILPLPAVAALDSLGLGNIVQPGGNDILPFVIGFLPIIGTILLLAGLAYYAKAKGRHPAWCILAVFSCIGLIVLASLKDKVPHGDPRLLRP